MSGESNALCEGGIGRIKVMERERYGMFGGRPMGMYTASSNGDQWPKSSESTSIQIDQYERSFGPRKVSREVTGKARKWLEELSTVQLRRKAVDS